MNRISRRGFLQTAAASTAFPLVTIAGTKSSGRVLGANDTIRVGVAGIHGQGNSHIGQYLGMKNVQVTYLIDPDSRLFKSRGDRIKSKGGHGVGRGCCHSATYEPAAEAMATKNTKRHKKELEGMSTPVLLALLPFCAFLCFSWPFSSSA